MNKALKEIKKLINESIIKYLPDVKSSDLEEDGNIYYMNGKNGTEFDWYVNEHISDFMVFYSDEKNLGALKLTLYSDGNILIYIYGDKGNKIVQKIETTMNITEQELLDLAVLLKKEADDKKIFDRSIDEIDSDIKVSEDEINGFKSDAKSFDKMRIRKKMINLNAIVSAKIVKEGYKVGYMVRYNPHDAEDSGWQFLAGNEDEGYLNDIKNIGLLPLAYVINLDPDVLKHIDNPIGTKLIRISSNEFEIDKQNKNIYVEKRKHNGEENNVNV